MTVLMELEKMLASGEIKTPAHRDQFAAVLRKAREVGTRERKLAALIKSGKEARARDRILMRSRCPHEFVYRDMTRGETIRCFNCRIVTRPGDTRDNHLHFSWQDAVERLASQTTH